jgi:hypothetical protein
VIHSEYQAVSDPLNLSPAMITAKGFEFKLARCIFKPIGIS